MRPRPSSHAAYPSGRGGVNRPPAGHGRATARSGSTRASTRTGSTPRRPPNARVATSGGDGNQWNGMQFYLQIERCAGVDHTCSVRLEEEVYTKRSEALADGIERFFEGRFEVVILDVPTLYALEVRVMPSACHPQHGLKIYGQDAVARGCQTIHSKTASKKWPNLKDICLQLQEFSRIPVVIHLYANEKLDAGVIGRDGSLSENVRNSVNGSARGRRKPPDLELEGEHLEGEHVRTEQLGPLGHATFRVIHSSGKEYQLYTDADGHTEVSLHPGIFELRSEEGSSYDRLVPNLLEVPPQFSPLEFSVTAFMKKNCTFLVVDHMNKPFPRFQLRLTSRDSASEPIILKTKANGKARGRVGMGFHVASYGGAEEQSLWPIEPLSQDIEVMDIDQPQLFRICVRRVRFTCEIVLRTRYDEPVRRCPFTIRKPDGSRDAREVASGVTSEIGVACCELPAGRLIFALEPPALLPFVPAQFILEVSSDGVYTPESREVDTKTVDVEMHLVTPDGEPAANCKFSLGPKFSAAGSRALDLPLSSDENGRATGTVTLLEPYIFRIKAAGQGLEYMPQEFGFVTDRRSVTIVVAKTVLSKIPEDNVVFLVDASGSMQGYMRDVISALNLAIVQQFHKSSKRFNVLAFTESQVEFRPELVEATRENVENAMRFCEHIQAGGSSNIAAALRRVFRFKQAHAVYLITDGKCDVTEELLTHLKILCLGHPLRPKLHTVGINCVPGRTTYRALQALSQLTQGNFRPVCLEQDHSSALMAARAGHAAKDSEPILPNLAQASTDEDPETAADTAGEDETGHEDDDPNYSADSP